MISTTILELPYTVHDHMRSYASCFITTLTPLDVAWEASEALHTNINSEHHPLKVPHGKLVNNSALF